MIFEKWNFKTGDTAIKNVTTPCSFYSVLLENGKMEDPFWRENEYNAREMCRADCSFETVFTATADDLKKQYQTLRLANLDTVCDIFLNGKKLAHTENMHRHFVFDVKGKVNLGENTLLVYINSPIAEIERLQSRREIYGATDIIDGAYHLRKPFCMSGWDWGPQLPDMGIYGKCEFLCFDTKLETVEIRQKHRQNGSVELTITPEITGEIDAFSTTVTYKDKTYTAVFDDGVGTLTVPDPELWWPNGYGAQPLYTVTTTALKSGKVIDENSQKIGLRTVTVHSLRDEYGKDFTFVVNGVKIFCMGADYIPEDSIFPRITKDVIDRLLKDCIAANFNMLRIWGGGYYPSDEFFNLCDEYGILIWQDFMYACCVPHFSKKIKENLAPEIRDTVKRIRNHASLALLCGNNEIEESLCYHKDGSVGNDFRLAYLEIFHRLIPDICDELAPDIFYWPSSPSCGWNTDGATNPDAGDTHFWQVWHGRKDFTEYRKYYFRFLSEFGFQSFPCMKTIESFTLPKDRNIFSPVMESHQKNGTANGKILEYMARNYRYVKGLRELSYISQLNQADAMKYGVEHLRRNRGRCMGTLYWQLNDCWPVASWSSIDYFGRWKATHYYAKKFYAPILMSVEDTDTKMRINIANETFSDFVGTVKWAVKDNNFNVLSDGEFAVTSSPLSAKYIAEIDLSEHIADRRSNFFVCTLYNSKGEYVSKQVLLLCKPKEFDYKLPEIKTDILEENGKTVIYISANAFVHNLEISFKNVDTVLSDNFFSLTDSEFVKITLQTQISPETVKNEIQLISINHTADNY